MKLHEHPDFEQAILNAVDHFSARNLRPAIIEKDYYVTEALRAIADSAGNKIIFKGGTSLSKGWNLIERFSEDIDIFLDPTAFDPHLGKRGIDRELKKLRDAINVHPALSLVSSINGNVSCSASENFQVGLLCWVRSRACEDFCKQPGVISLPTSS